MEENEKKVTEEIASTQEEVQTNTELKSNEKNEEPEKQEVEQSVESEESTEPVAEKLTEETDSQEEKQPEPVSTEENGGSTTSDKTDLPAKEEEKEDKESNILDDLKLEEATKDDIFNVLKQFNGTDNIKLLDRALKELKPAFDKLYRAEKEAALEQFLAEEGNDQADFKFHGSDVDRQFFSTYELLREKRKKYYATLEKEKDSNLKSKNDLLDKLRTLLDGEESNASINQVKEIQEEWKKIGPVPGSHNKTLWASFNALLDRFYDNRSIYFELKELDRKKNYEAKIELCEKAEALDTVSELNEAIKILNDLHEEYKHIGPVPKDDQEALWQRFKTASDAIYAKRKDFYDHLKVELTANMEKKQALGDKLEELAKFDSDRINDWNKKTKELLELQKEWDKIGGVPREKSKAVNKHFWSNFKQFFSNKNKFFKKLESERTDNLNLKKELVKKAESLKNSEEWDKTANELKNLQNEWRNIGPVPEKVRNEVYAKFKAACDHFFERKRGGGDAGNEEYADNLKKKSDICSMLDAYLNSDVIEMDQVNGLLDDYSNVGYVPKDAIDEIHKRFDEITDKLLGLEELSDEQRSELDLKIQINKLKNSPHGEQKIQRKENAIKRDISALESEISNWRTNMGFFAASKNADQLKVEMEGKIEKAEKELQRMKTQLKVLRRM